jgi:hypothetical protein
MRKAEIKIERGTVSMREFTNSELKKIESIVEFIVGGAEKLLGDRDDDIILRYTKGEGFDDFFEFYDLEESIQEELGLDVIISAGATKIVAIERKQNYVIKIPMDGSIVAQVDITTNDNYTTYTSTYKEKDIKYYDCDYCQIEADNYSAMPDNLKKLFFETIKLGELENGISYYVQERMAEAYDFSFGEGHISYLTKNKLNDLLTTIKSNGIYNKNYMLNFGIINALLYLYDEATVYQLYQALMDLKINDIHFANLGYDINGDLKIFDYSGYHN